MPAVPQQNISLNRYERIVMTILCASIALAMIAYSCWISPHETQLFRGFRQSTASTDQRQWLAGISFGLGMVCMLLGLLAS